MLEWVVLDNDLRTWIIALVIGAGVFLALGLLRRLACRQLERIRHRTNNIWDDILYRVVTVTRGWLMFAVGVWAASQVLALADRWRDLLATIVIIAILAQIGVWGAAAIRTYVRLYAEENLERDAASVMTVRALGFLATVTLWVLVFVVFLDNLGFDVNALVAGLGIGGIAVALAAQNILGDLFASLSIVLDKPFVVGDFIIVDDLPGTVERVGLKTTRVRSLSGEQLVFSNTDLLSSRIRNFKRMFERRIVFSFGVEYGTPRESLEWIPGMVQETIEALPDTRFDRAHFKGYGDSSLNFEVVFFVLKPEYNTYMDRQQTINLELYRKLEERDVAFAFPTRTLHIVPSEVSADI